MDLHSVEMNPVILRIHILHFNEWEIIYRLILFNYLWIHLPINELDEKSIVINW